MAGRILILMPILLASCGGRSLGVDGPPGPDALAPSDARVVLPEACEGSAWVAGPGEPPRAVTVTSTRIAMDCCDGATAHFHAASWLGIDPVVMFRSWGLWPSPGTFDLGAIGPDLALEVQVYPAGGGTTEEQRLEGWLRLEGEGDPYSSPAGLSVCVTSIEGGPEVEGLRLWVPHLPIMPFEWWDRFALHVLSDPELTAREAAALPLGELVLDPMPLVTLGNLAFYERSTHTLHFEPWYGDQLRGLLPEVGVYGLPFVVVVDEEPLYLGGFFTALSSASFGRPVIVLEDIAEGVARIERAYPGPGAATGADPRANPRLVELLEAAGKLAP